MVVALVLGVAASGSDGGVAMPRGELGAVVEAQRTEAGERGSGPQGWREDRDEGYEEKEGEYNGCRLSKLDLIDMCVALQQVSNLRD